MAATMEEGFGEDYERWQEACEILAQLKKAKFGSEQHIALLAQLKKLIPPGIYQHHKSTPESPKLYIVLGVGNHRESGEYQVTCVALYPPYCSELGHAPIVDNKGGFLTPVNASGTELPRFKFLRPLKMSFKEFLKLNAM